MDIHPAAVSWGLILRGRSTKVWVAIALIAAAVLFVRLVASGEIDGLIYVLWIFGLMAVVPLQVGFWASSSDPEDGPLSRGFRIVGPVVIFAVLCSLYANSDWTRSLRAMN